VFATVIFIQPVVVIMYNLTVDSGLRVIQMIIAVSQLIGNGVIISDTHFTESLSIISSYASNDKAVQVQCPLLLVYL